MIDVNIRNCKLRFSTCLPKNLSTPVQFWFIVLPLKSCEIQINRNLKLITREKLNTFFNWRHQICFSSHGFLTLPRNRNYQKNNYLTIDSLSQIKIQLKAVLVNRILNYKRKFWLSIVFLKGCLHYLVLTGSRILLTGYRFTIWFINITFWPFGV